MLNLELYAACTGKFKCSYFAWYVVMALSCDTMLSSGTGHRVTDLVWLGLAYRKLSLADTSLRIVGYHCLLHLGLFRH